MVWLRGQFNNYLRFTRVADVDITFVANFNCNK